MDFKSTENLNSSGLQLNLLVRLVVNYQYCMNSSLLQQLESCLDGLNQSLLKQLLQLMLLLVPWQVPILQVVRKWISHFIML